MQCLPDQHANSGKISDKEVSTPLSLAPVKHRSGAAGCRPGLSFCPCPLTEEHNEEHSTAPAPPRPWRGAPGRTCAPVQAQATARQAATHAAGPRPGTRINASPLPPLPPRRPRSRAPRGATGAGAVRTTSAARPLVRSPGGRRPGCAARRGPGGPGGRAEAGRGGGGRAIGAAMADGAGQCVSRRRQLQGGPYGGLPQTGLRPWESRPCRLGCACPLPDLDLLRSGGY